ncbi:MAG: hypothetical protein NVS9B12_14130 [Vulcanimicrobiaceae bacterium]
MGQMGDEHPSTLEGLLGENRLAEASALLDRDGFDLFDRQGAGPLARALSAIGVTAETSSPVVLGLKALLESHAGRADTAEAWFRLALARAEDKHRKAEVTHRFALDLLRQERFGALELLLPLVEDRELSPRLLASINATIATVHARTTGPSTTDGLPSLQVALRLLETMHDPVLTARIHQQAAYVFLEAGRHDGAQDYALSSVALAEKYRLYDVLIRSYTVLYNVASRDDDSRKLLVYLEKIRRYAVKTGDHSMELYALIASCDVQTRRGDLPALSALDRALSVLEVRYDDAAGEGLLPSQALRSAWHGDFTHAFRLLESTIERQRTIDRQALRACEVALYAAAMIDKTADEAIARALEKLALVKEVNLRLRRAQCLAALACALSGALHEARSILKSVHAAPDSGVSALKHAVHSTIDRFSGHQNHDEFAAACEQLRARGYGGYVRLLEALPIASALQRRFARLDEADIASLQIYLAGSALSAPQERSLCAKLECAKPAHVLTLAMRYSPYPVPVAAR